MNFLKIPATFNSTYIEKIIELNAKYGTKSQVVETYGSLPKSIVGSTREASILPKIDLDEISAHVKSLKRAGLKFNYAMNAFWCNGLERTKEGRDKIFKELESIFSAGIERVTVASTFIMNHISRYYPAVEMVASINLSVSTLHEIERLKNLGISRVAIDRFSNRDFKLLKAIKAIEGMEYELLLNSLCNLFCNTYMLHNLTSTSNNEHTEGCDFDYPVLQCMRNHLANPTSILCASWIRPDDLKMYEEVGINNFKLDGRGLPMETVLSHLEIYMSGRHDGNIFDIFDFFNRDIKNVPEFGFSLDNRELDNFLEGFVSGRKNCRYCKGDHPECTSVSQKIEVKKFENLQSYNSIIKRTFNKNGLNAVKILSRGQNG